MTMITDEMLKDREFFYALGKKAWQELLIKVDKTIEGLVYEVINNEVLEELKKNNPGGLSCPSIFLEEIIDNL